MPSSDPIPVDVLILGGGCAGLWIAHRLMAGGHRCLLLEADALGTGQTIAAQGIIHGGLKYSLAGLLNASARAVREMPERWRRSLAGDEAPDFSSVTMRAESCHLWQTTSLRSRVGMLGARAGLRVTPVSMPAADRPDVLRTCPGTVARLDEPVVDPASVLEALAGPIRPSLLHVDTAGTTFHRSAGDVDHVAIVAPDGQSTSIAPRTVILAAGGGNDDLRAACGLEPIMQRRPLHMVVAQGELPLLNGHCVDGSSTRVTITTARGRGGQRVWQIGGQLAERGVEMDEPALIQHAIDELAAVLPDAPLESAEWSTYRVDRAEPGTGSGARPDDIFASAEGNVITAWPTKMALAPRLADHIATMIGRPTSDSNADAESLTDWPRPVVARPPWEITR